MFEQWVEMDLNPFIAFDNEGKIQYANNEAQYLLNKISAKQLFELALQYAPKSFGFNTVYVNKNIANSYLLYAITTGYQDEETIGLKLYKSSLPKKETKIATNAQVTNIFSIVDLCISTNKIKTKSNFEKSYDPSIPDFKIVVNDVLKVLNIIYANFFQYETIYTTVKFQTGEYLKLNGKKLPIVSIVVSHKEQATIEYETIKEIEEFANSLGVLLETGERQIQINLPLVLE